MSILECAKTGYKRRELKVQRCATKNTQNQSFDLEIINMEIVKIKRRLITREENEISCMVLKNVGISVNYEISLGISCS